jgi:hypothetical protein
MGRGARRVVENVVAPVTNLFHRRHEPQEVQAAPPPQPAPAPPPAPVVAPAPVAAAPNPINEDIRAHRDLLAKEADRATKELAASKQKLAAGLARSARARRGNIFEEGSPNNQPFRQTLGG